MRLILETGGMVLQNNPRIFAKDFSRITSILAAIVSRNVFTNKKHEQFYCMVTIMI